MITTVEAHHRYDRLKNYQKSNQKGKLVKVTVTNNTFNHEFDDINRAVSLNDEIQTLEIKNSQFNVVSMKLLENCQFLTHLTINSTNLCDFGFENVKNCRMLQFIDLSNNQIEEPNASLLNLKFLEFLSYGNNRISRISMEFIENVEKSNLKLLNFILNPIISELFMTTPKEIAKLLKKCYYHNFQVNFSLQHAEKSIKLLKSSGLESDYKIYTIDKMFEVHKCILSENSRIFRQIIKMQDIEQTKNEFRIDSYSTEAFEEFLNFLYDGILPRSLQNLIEIYNISKQFEVDDLKMFCEFLIIQNYC